MKQREVEREISKVLVTPWWEDIARISVLDLFLTRDSDLVDDLLDEHLAVVQLKRDDWERLKFLRANLTPAHRPQLEEALEHTQRAGVVELLAWTCTKQKEFTAALERADAGKSLQLAIDYATRRFIGEPGVAAKLWKRAKPFATSAARGKWLDAGQQAWRALYVTDTKETADAVAAMIEATYIYTNYGTKERICTAAAKRARALKHASRCKKPLVVAVGESYTDEEITHSAVAIAGGAVKKALEEESGHESKLGGLLALAPKSKAYQDRAKKALLAHLKETTNVGLSDVGEVSGLVMGIERGKVRALYPLLEKVSKWRITGSPYDNHGKERAEVAAALVRLRARKVLDGG